MTNSSFPPARFILTGCLLLLFASCDRRSEFDALANFPGNRKQLGPADVEYIPLSKPGRAVRNRLDGPHESEEENASAEVIVQDGVTGFPFEKSLTSGKGRFTLLETIKTGFRVRTSDELKSQNAFLMRTPFTASGIAIGDLDADGLQDIVIASRKSGMRVFRNTGNMTFRDITGKVARDLDGVHGTSPSIIDINDDGLMDIYLCCYNKPNRLLVSRGRSFKEQAERLELDFTGASVTGSFADYDRDGDLDLFLLTHRLEPRTKTGKLPVDREPGKPPQVREKYLELNHLIETREGKYIVVESGQFDRLYRNDGYRFVDVTRESGIGLHPYRGVSATWCDIDHDGWLDLYVANDFKDPDQLFKSNGPDEDGIVRFEDVADEVLPRVPWFSKGADFGDLNNDGLIELLATGSLGSHHRSAIAGNGILHGEKSESWFLNWGRPAQSMANALYLNTGGGFLGDVANLAGVAGTDWSWSVKTADLDNDGRLDLLYTNGNIRDFLNNDLNREIASTEANEDFFWLDKEKVRRSDFVFKNEGDLNFADHSQQWNLGEPYLGQTLATADLDNDGDLDLVSAGFGEEVRVHRNDIGRARSIRIQLAGIDSNSQGLGATVTLQVEENGPIQTRQASTTRGFMSSSEPVLHFGVGEAGRVHRVQIDWPSGGTQKLFELKSGYLYRIEESKADGFVDSRSGKRTRQPLFSSKRSPLNLEEADELEFNDSELQPALPFWHSRLGPSLAWSDIDGDGDYDLFRGGSAFDPGVIMADSGEFQLDPTRQPELESDSKSEDLGAIFFDADNDGDQDLYVVSGGVEADEDDSTMIDRLYLNDGSGLFEKSDSLLDEIPHGGSAVAAADFDGDGRVDLFVGGRVRPGNYPRPPGSRLLKNTNAGFTDVTEEIAPGLANTGMVTAAVWVDIDGDQQLDLLVSHEWGPVMCFQNRNGKLADVSGRAGLLERTGMFNSLAPGDVDNDGDTDFVVGNLGTNTPYQASPEEPIHIYHGSFDSAGGRQIVEALTIDGKMFPRSGLERWQETMPSIAARYSLSQDFATAELNQIIPTATLEASFRLSANSLESGILINESSPGEIRFSFISLPYWAQTAPIYGCQLVEVTGDQNLDLLAVQNNSNTPQEKDRFNSGIGVVMSGNGDGTFEPISPKLSGIELPFDGRSLTTGDFNRDSRVDFVVATNGDGTRVFSSQARFNGRMIDLCGLLPGKNLIGAKVLLDFGDGKQQLHELTCGSGYLSQSPPLIFVGSRKPVGVSIRLPDGTEVDRELNELFRR